MEHYTSGADTQPARPLYESLVNGGGTGSLAELACKLRDVRSIDGFVVDADRKVLRPEFTLAMYLDYLAILLPESEVRQTSPHGNLHVLVRLKRPLSRKRIKQARRIHRRLRMVMFGDPQQVLLLTKARAIDSASNYDGFAVAQIKPGTPCSTKIIYSNTGRRPPETTEAVLRALLRSLPAKDGAPCWDGSDSHCVCPIHGSGQSRKQASIGGDSVTCFADCKNANDDKPKKWTILDILRQRVLNESADAQEILKAWRKHLGANPDASPVPSVVITDGNDCIGTFCEPTFKVLAESGTYFEDPLARQVVQIHLGKPVSLTRHTGESIRFALPATVQFVANTEDGQKYVLLGKDQAPVLAAHPARALLPPLRRLVRTPTYDADLSLLSPGYNLASATWYDGTEVRPVEGLAHVGRLLSEFAFRSDGSRTNVIGLLLGSLLFEVVGNGPLGVIGANQPEVGKTLLAKVVGVIVDGVVPTTMSYRTDDDDMEKSLGAKLRLEPRTILIDNAKSRSARGVVSSACLERMVTDSVVTTRLLGKSMDITRTNDVVWLLSLNTPRLSTDLATRAVAVNLHFDGDPGARQFAFDPVAYALEHRAQILGELVGLVEAWKAAGRPLASGIEFRFRRWAEVVGGIMQVAGVGVGDLLTNRAQSVATQDADLVELAQLGDAHAGAELSASEWLERARALGVLGHVLGRPGSRAQQTAMGMALARAAGRRLGDPDLGERVVVFRATGDAKSRRYECSLAEAAVHVTAGPPDLGGPQVSARSGNGTHATPRGKEHDSGPPDLISPPAPGTDSDRESESNGGGRRSTRGPRSGRARQARTPEPVTPADLCADKVLPTSAEVPTDFWAGS